MPTAYILINTDIGSEFDVAKELKNIEGVENVSPVYGAYDIVVRVSAKSTDDLKRIITWQIRKLNNVRATLTNIIHEKPDDLRDNSMLSIT